MLETTTTTATITTTTTSSINQSFNENKSFTFIAFEFLFEFDEEGTQLGRSEESGWTFSLSSERLSLQSCKARQVNWAAPFNLATG